MVKDAKRPISFFIPALNGGGAQRVVVDLANALVDITNVPIHVVLVRREGVFLEDLRAEIVVVDLAKSRTLFAIPGLAMYLWRWRPSVMMASMSYANIAATFAHWLARRPGRLVLREATILNPTGAALSLRLRLFVALMRVCYSRADAVVANSHDTLNSLIKAGVALPERSCVIGNPVSLREPKAVAECDGPEEVSYICAVGRLVELKGFDVLLRALAKSRHSRLHLVILGEGPLRPSLVALARSLGLKDRLHMPGFINPPTAAMQNSVGFVLSSRWEGFGNVLVEALALGLPIIATACPGGPRDILADGRYGRLVPIDDVNALAKAIDEVLEVPVATPAARQARAALYSPSRIAKKYLNRVLLPTVAPN